jgi:hypothetical protein
MGRAVEIVVVEHVAGIGTVWRVWACCTGRDSVALWGKQRDVRRFVVASRLNGTVEEPVREPEVPRSQTRRLETRQECPDQ